MSQVTAVLVSDHFEVFFFANKYERRRGKTIVGKKMDSHFLAQETGFD